MGEFDALFKEFDEQESISAQFDRQQFEQPTPEAEVLNLAEHTGLPLDVVERNKQELSERVNALDYDKIRRESPVLARFLTDPKNRAHAQDEIEALSASEAETRGFLNNAISGMAERAATLTGNFLQSAESIGQVNEASAAKAGIDLPLGTGTIFDVARRAFDMEDLGARVGDTKFGYQPRFTWEKFKGEMSVESLAGYIAEQGIASIPDMVAAVVTLPSYIASRTQETAEARAENSGTAAPEQFLAAMPSAVLSASLERIGAKAVAALSDARTLDALASNGLKTALAQIGKAAAKEGGTEFLQENIDYAGEVIGVADYDLAVALDRGIAGMVAGSGMGATVRALTVTAERFTANAERSENEGNALDAFLGLAKKKMRTSNPEVFKAYVEDLAADQGVETVYVDAEAVNTFNQEERNEYLQGRLERANSDVEIPMQEFVTLPDNVVEALKPHARLSAGSISQAEAEQGLDIKQMIARAEREQADYTRAKDIYDEVAAQLAATETMSKRNAERSAMIIPAYMTTKAKREGMTVDEVYQRMGLEISTLSNDSDSAATNSDAVTFDQLGEQEVQAAEAKGLDMSPEARAQRAKEMGFDTAQVWYHGSARSGYVGSTDIEFFDREKIGDRWSADKAGFFFTDDPSEANYYATADADAREPGASEGAVYPARLKMKNPLIVDDEFLKSEGMKPLGEVDDTVNFWDTYQGLILEWARKGRHDGVILVDKLTPRKMGVVFDDNQVRSVNAAFDPDYEFNGELLAQKNRAQIVLFPNRRIIQLGEASDLSSFFHESGHLFLELERKFAENGSEAQQADFQKILDWLEIESADQIEREHHEKFARGFEAYIGEGKAPSLELKKVFRRFAEWIKGVYRTLAALDVELTDDIRGVMDRMLATDEQIARARASFGYDLNEEVDTESDDSATDRAEETLRTKLIKQLKRRAKKEWREESKAIGEKVREELVKDGVYNTIERLKEAKLDYDYVIETLDIPNLKGLPNLAGLTDKKKGRNPELMAEIMGYVSAHDMLTQITDAPTLTEAVSAEVEARMMAKHGDILNDGSIEREADAAVHSEEQARLLLKELRTVNPNAPDREALKQHAKDTIGRMEASKIKPKAFHRAEVKAAQRYTAALADGDVAEAARHKQEQLRQFYLFREALEAERRVELMRKHLKGVKTREYRDTEVSSEYAMNIKVLANLYDMRKSDAAQKLDGLANWLMAQANDPNEFLKPQVLDLVLSRVIDAKQQAKDNHMDWAQQIEIPTYKTMTVDELQGVYDMVRHLRWLGGKESNRAREERKAKNEALAAHIVDNGGKDVEVPDYEKKTAAVKSGLKRFFADHAKVRNVVLMMDGFKEFGKVQQAIFQPIVDATNAEVEMQMDYAKRIEEIWKPMNAKLAKGKDARTITKENGRKWTLARRERIMLGLYWGSPESREAILRGHDVTELDVAHMMQHLSHDDLDFMESVWALNETLWPKFAAMNSKVFGVIPPKVEHKPFSLKGRQLKGGYMRLYYDYAAQDAGRKDMHESTSDFLASGQAIAMSKSGAAFTRVGSGGRRVDLDPQNIFNALQDSIHAITFTEVSRDVSRIVKSEPVAKAVIQKYGDERYQSMLDNLEGIFMGSRGSNHPIAQFMKRVRTNMSLGLLAFSIRNFVQQPIALTNVLGRVGEADTVRGLMEFYSSPNAKREFVQSKSMFMRNRTAFVNREVSEHLAGLNAGKGGQVGVWLKKHAFDLQTLGDAAVAYPAWIAAYNQGRKQFDDDTRAAQYADEIVAATIGSGLNKDLSTIMQGGGGVAKTLGPEMTKQLTFMGSFFNVVYNLMHESVHRNDLNTVKGFANFSREMAWYLVAPAILSQLVISNWPGEDDEEGLAEWTAKAVGEYGIGAVFMFREIASALKGFDASIPGQAAAGGAVRAGSELVEAAADGEADLKDAASFIRGAMPLIPAPGSGQVARFLQYLDSYNQGDEGDFNLYDALVEGKERNK